MVLKVEFASNEKYKKIRALTQYDYGQLLEIHGLLLPTTIWAYFITKKNGGKCKRVLGSTASGVTTVAIPDEMFVNDGFEWDYDIYVCLVVFDADSARTEYGICIPIRSIPKPEDYEPITPEEETLFEQFASAINHSITDLKKDISQLSEKIATVLPKVTTSDNGKFLRVVNGAWAAAALTDVSQEGA